MVGIGAVFVISFVSLPFSPVFTMSIFSVVLIVVLLIVTPREDIVSVVVHVVVVVYTVMPSGILITFPNDDNNFGDVIGAGESSLC
jgi:hypothetical protein